MIKVSDFIFDFLAKAGRADTVFMLPGGGCMHLVDSLGRNEKLKYVCMLHEQAAAIAAEAYAQNINDFAIALVTAGPGATNAVTGVAGAFIDSTPLIVLSGQAKRADMVNGRGVRQMGIQEVDIESIVRPITKYAKCIKDENEVPYELEKAVWIATHDRRGPVWLDVPLDVQGAYIDVDKCRHFLSEKEESFNYTKKELLESICGLLGGRVAEEVTFGEITTGAYDDFKKATKIARSMVTEYGMSNLGPMMLEEKDGNTFLGRDYTKNRNISDIVAHEIDEEMRSIINSCYDKTKQLLIENKDLLELIANTLLEEETITKEQIDYLVENGHLPKEETSETNNKEVKEEKETKKSRKSRKEDTK